MLDNGGWQAVKSAVQRVYPKGVAAETDQFQSRLMSGRQGERRDFSEVAKAFGAHGECVTEPDELAAAIDRALPHWTTARPPCCMFTSRGFESDKGTRSMRIPNRYSRCSACLGFAGLVANALAPAFAQEDPAKYPTRPIHLIVGFAAGGGNDIIARVFGQKLSESLGQPVIVENKPGGGAIVATDYVAKSAPDGYTLLMSASGISINPAVYAKLPYDAVNDFVAVSELASFPLIMIVSANSPIKSVAELVTYAKANPDKTNYASSSASFQLVTELFKQKTGAPMQVIPYKSANESVLAVISGQVTTTIADAGPVFSRSRAARRARWRSPRPGGSTTCPTCRR